MEQTTIPTERSIGFPRLLRCRKTNRYFAFDGWTEDPSQAEVFPDEVTAVRACVQHRLHHVELVIRSGDTDIFSCLIR